MTMPGFVVSAEARIPILRTFINALQSIYVSRSGTAEQKASQVD
jgi:hypothetical protein